MSLSSSLKPNTIRASTSVDEQVLGWLLERDQPSVRYQTLIDILGRKENDREVKEAYAQIPIRGWASDILQLQKPKGYWEPKEPSWSKDILGWIEFLYRPKYIATNWQALVLADLGLTSKEKRIKKIADLFFDYKLRLSSAFNFFTEEACIVGNTARMMTRFGYYDDYRVRKLYDRLLEDQIEDGGWNCFNHDRGTLDNWEPLAAYAALPKQARTRKIKRSIEKGAEFYLERKLFEEGKRKYAPWFRFHYPNHYYYDILIGLDILTELGYADDRRLGPALKILKEKRQKDGTWLLDRVHPDLAGVKESGYGVEKSVKPLALEQVGMPSKWITLKALRVLKRVEDAS